MTRRDPLATLLRMRQATLEETQKAVANAYQVERDACALVERAERALDEEAKAAVSLSNGDETVESYARWLPVGRRAVERAHDVQRTATVELDRARVLLGLSRAGVNAVECQIETRDKAELRQATRRDQTTADEVAGNTFMTRMARMDR